MSQFTNASIDATVTLIECRIGLSPGIQDGPTTHRLRIEISEKKDKCRRRNSSADSAGLLFGHHDYEIRSSQSLGRDQCGAVRGKIDAKLCGCNQRAGRRGAIRADETGGCHLYSARDLGPTRTQECGGSKGTPADIAVTYEEYRPRPEPFQRDLSRAPTPSVETRGWGVAKVADPRPLRQS